ncbi:hypothetical protein DFH06DRAFT_1150563 [Mycena polygramma]|nr:hypothetical protein DFH06DRAFT_1150563 [Mycena polygramma]
MSFCCAAGRIWWICRQCRKYSTHRTDAQRRCMSTISILVESGVLYSATVLGYLIVGAFPSTNIVQEPIYEMLTQVMGIAPTLIIVRVGLESDGVKRMGVIARHRLCPLFRMMSKMGRWNIGRGAWWTRMEGYEHLTGSI